MDDDGKRGTRDVLKLRMKIGAHEFEAEGPHDVVTAQFAAWKALAGFASAPHEQTAAAPPHNLASTSPDTDPMLTKLFAVDAAQKLITLRIRLSGHRRNADAALLILYGYRSAFAADDGARVPAARLKAALAASGYSPKRVDRAVAPHVAAGFVRKDGRHMHEAYALTTPGSQYAANLARQLAR